MICANSTSASRVASGCSIISMWPAAGRVTNLAPLIASASSARVARRRHAVELAGHDQGRAVQPGRRLEAALVGVAGGEIGVQRGAGRALEQPHGVAHHPAARRLVAADVAGRPEAPVADQLGGERPGPAAASSSAGWTGIFAARAEQREPRDPPAVARRELEADQGTHRVADQVHRGDAHGRDQLPAASRPWPRSRPARRASLRPWPGRSTASAFQPR